MIASDVYPEPSEPRNFTAMMRAVQQTPATPVALLPTAAAVPDVCEPWPWSSIGSPS